MKKTSKFLSFFLVLICILSTSISGFATDKISDDVSVDADIALLINLDDANKTVVYSKNAEKRTSPASLTKIATAATALSKGVDLDAKTTVSRNAIHSLDGTGSVMANLIEGEEVTIRQLISLILIHSAGDACNVLAEYIAGDVTSYMVMVNQWVKDTGCENTSFVNPVGLEEKNHYSTASDLAKITLAALTYPDFKTISSTVTYEMEATNKSGPRKFTHRNSMLNKGTGYYYQYASGIKTGTTEEAGRCVITTASKDGYQYMCVIMKGILKDYTADGLADNGAFFDATNLFKWAFSNFKFKTIVKEGQVVATVPLKNAKDSDTLQVVPKIAVSSLVPATLDASTVIVKVNDDFPKEVKAPVKKGDVIGKGTVFYANEAISEIELISSADIKQSIPLLIINSIKDMLSTTWAKVLAVLIILCIIAYLTITIIYNIKRKKKKMRPVKNYRNM